MVNYENGKIYKIVCNITGLCYIGSTCEPTLARRLAEHVGDYKGYKNGKRSYISSFKVLENNDYYIILLENVTNCVSKDQLHARERFYIENNKCVNKYVVGRTRKEYKKEYYEENKEIILEKGKEKHNCPCGGHYTTCVRARHTKTAKHKEYVRLKTLKECLHKKLSFSETKKVMEAL
jgi:hypothetical protein